MTRTAPAPGQPLFDDRTVLGIVLMIGFCATAPLIDVASKLAAAALPVGQITWARFVVQAVLMLPVCLMMRQALRFDPRLIGPLALRAVFLLVSTYCFVAAIRVMPIADALAIVFVEPFILLLLGRLLFGDEVGPRRIVASVVGFAGALLVIRPSFAAFGPVALYPLGTAVSFAFYMLATRSLSRQMHPVPMQFHTSGLAALLCVPVFGLAQIWPVADLAILRPDGLLWLWLGLVGLASAVSHLLMSYALRFAPTATLAPLHYLEIVMAVLLGYLVFGDIPVLMTFVGMAVITASGLYVFHRERLAEKRAALEQLAVQGGPR